MSGFKRRSLAGRGANEAPADRPELVRHYGARGLLKRLEREAPAAREALKWTAEQWSGFMERHREERKLPATERKMADICRNSQERIFMQVLGVAFGLPTAHHPSLYDTFPSLLRWCRAVLAYVVELEDIVQAAESAAAVEAMKLGLADAEVEARGTHIQELQRGLTEIEGQLADSEAARHRLANRAESEARNLRRDLAAAEETREAWKLTAATTAAALDLVRRRGGAFVLDAEVVPDGSLAVRRPG